eukprot:3842997-Prymnesium_polylepis.1
MGGTAAAEKRAVMRVAADGSVTAARVAAMTEMRSMTGAMAAVLMVMAARAVGVLEKCKRGKAATGRVAEEAMPVS